MCSVALYSYQLFSHRLGDVKGRGFCLDSVAARWISARADVPKSFLICSQDLSAWHPARWCCMVLEGEVCKWRAGAAWQIVDAMRSSLWSGAISLLPLRWGRCLLFPPYSQYSFKKISSQGKQKSFDFLDAYSKKKNTLPQRPIQTVMYHQKLCLITCKILSLDILSKIHVHYQQLQDSTPGMAPFQWWNHTGMCFSSKC